MLGHSWQPRAGLEDNTRNSPFLRCFLMILLTPMGWLVCFSMGCLQFFPVLGKCLFPSLTPTTHKRRRKVTCMGVAECRRCLSEMQVVSPRAFIPCTIFIFCCFIYPNHIKTEFILHWIICSEVESIHHSSSIQLKTSFFAWAVVALRYYDVRQAGVAIKGLVHIIQQITPSF